jgi:TolB-like protein/Tfp pilus assembly protein PilF
MGNGHPGQTAVRFAEFEADFRTGELRKGGVTVNLQEQPLQILQMLLEHPGQVVTRDELRHRIWPKNTFVDFEQGLYNSVRRLRNALDDSVESPRFIETLARRGYRFIGTVKVSPRQIESLAVLPLEDLSRNPEQEYFAEGMTEALITSLAKIGLLRVVSRTTVMQYKGVRKPLPAIAAELGVDVIVEGTVLRVENRVRITAQLIDASKETHLWSESYERDLRDVLALQAEVAQAIAREIRVTLAPVDQARFPEIRTVDPESYEAYLKGRYHWHRRSAEGLRQAIRYFQQAVAEDPNYADAYAGLADVLSVLGLWGFVSPDQGCGRSRELARRAIELNPSLAEAHASLAWATMLHDHDFVAAERHFERSIELNPRYATAHQWFGLLLAWTGRFEEGYAELKRAIRLDPHPMVIHVLGYLYFIKGRDEEAIEQFEKALELDPGLAQSYQVLGLTYLHMGRFETAIAAGRKAVELSPRAALFIATLGEIYAAAGYQDEAQRTLEQLMEFSKQAHVSPCGMAHFYAAWGKKEEALSALERGYRERDPFMVWLKTDFRYDDLRTDPRFQDLLRRMNFPS